jgi:hypothetical protein
LGDIVAIEFGQTDVYQSDISLQFARHGYGLFTVVRQMYLMPRQFEQHAEGLRGVLIIINNQNSTRLSRHR